MSEPAAARTGLRAQKLAKRRQEILSAAEDLFLNKGFEATLMSEVANRVDVSTPTVFNYFGSKVELLLAVILKAHDAACARAAETRATWKGDAAGGVTKILQVYSEISHRILSKQAWRYAEATNISNPDSEFVRAYQAIDIRNTEQLEAFLRAALPPHLRQPETTTLLAQTLYNNWLSRFIAFIRDDRQTLEEFHALTERDVHGLLRLLLS